MENASKALIIAGAILLSILLISLGIMIFTQAQDTVNNSGMSDAEIQTFNSKLQKYESTAGISGSQVKTMINEIIAINAKEANSIKLTTGSATGANLTSTSWVNTGKNYAITFKYATSGKINEVKIVQK